MRMNERTLRDVLRQEAESVRPPADLWAGMEREVASIAAACRRAGHPVRTPVRARTLLAAGAALSLLWVLMLPAGTLSPPQAEQQAVLTAPAHVGDGLLDGPWQTIRRHRSGVTLESGTQWSPRRIAMVR